MRVMICVSFAHALYIYVLHVKKMACFIAGYEVAIRDMQATSIIISISE